MSTTHTPSTGHGFGTAPVFHASISTILGAVLFLRFGYAVANVGLLGAFLIILVGCGIGVGGPENASGHRRRPGRALAIRHRLPRPRCRQQERTTQRHHHHRRHRRDLRGGRQRRLRRPHHLDVLHAEIEILVAAPEERAAGEEAKIEETLASGRIPVSPRNVRILPTDANADFSQLVKEHSAAADLVVLGFTMPRLSSKGAELLQRHPELQDVLFVCADTRLTID